MKAKFLALALAAVAACGSAIAGPVFTFTNVPAGWDGEYEVKFAGAESFTSLAPGGQNFGVLQVTSIIAVGNGNNTTIWADGSGDAQVVGVFSGLTVDASSSGSTLNATGGSISLYLNTAGTFSAAGGLSQGLNGYNIAGCSANSSANCYNGVSNDGATTLLTANWVAGIDGSGSPITVTGTLNETAGGATGGNAEGLLQVTGGSDAALFATGGFNSTTDPANFTGSNYADMYTQNNFCVPGSLGCSLSPAAAGAALGAANEWGFSVQDPVSGAVKLPEPASLALVGLGLIGAGVVRRRKA